MPGPMSAPNGDARLVAMTAKQRAEFPALHRFQGQSGPVPAVRVSSALALKCVTATRVASRSAAPRR